MGLHARSLQLLNIGEPEARMAFVERWRGKPLVFTTVTTCMEVIKQAVDKVRRDWGASSAGLWVWALQEVISYNCLEIFHRTGAAVVTYNLREHPHPQASAGGPPVPRLGIYGVRRAGDRKLRKP